MSILDRFRNKQPPTKPRGSSGRAHYDGFLEFEERNPDLSFPAGMRVYDKMYRTDPDIRRVVWMVCNPIIGATWTVEPFGGDDAEGKDLEAAECVEWALFTHMAPHFTGHLAQALPVGVRSGFAPFEEVWEEAEWNGRKLLVPKTLGLRLPRSILRFNQRDEELESIEQLLPSGENVTIPAEDLLYYRFGAEGDNWEGTSLLRAAYKPWYLKDKLEKIDVMKQEREAMGIPICYPPENASEEALEEMEKILGGVRAAEQGFIIAPGPHAQDLKDLVAQKGWRIEILGIGKGQTTTDVKPSLEYHSDKIAAAFVAEFMRLGQGVGAVGARATADVQQNPFLAAVESLAGEVESVLDQLVYRITALNFDVEGPPKLRMSLIDSTSLEELAGYVEKLVKAEALKPDNELEDWLRERGDLPPADAAARTERESQAEVAREAAQKAAEEPPVPQPGPDEPSTPAPPQSPEPLPKRQLARQSRPLRPWERQMALDAVESAIDGARARFESGAAEPARALAKDLTARAQQGAHPKPPATPPADLVSAIEAELLSLYDTGRATLQDELQAQRDGIELAGNPKLLHSSYTLAKPPLATLRKLSQRARLAAQGVLARTWQAVSRPAVGGRATDAQVQKAGEAEAAAALRAEAQVHAAAALNMGRSDEMAAHVSEIEGTRYTSILDENTCEPCAQADDDVLRPLDDPVRLANEPPNPECEGGDRCRCMEFAELISEEPASA